MPKCHYKTSQGLGDQQLDLLTLTVSLAIELVNTKTSVGCLVFFLQIVLIFKISYPALPTHTQDVPMFAEIKRQNLLSRNLKPKGFDSMTLQLITKIRRFVKEEPKLWMVSKRRCTYACLHFLFKTCSTSSCTTAVSIPLRVFLILIMETVPGEKWEEVSKHTGLSTAVKRVNDTAISH